MTRPKATGSASDLPLCDIVLESLRAQVHNLRTLDPLVREEAPGAVTDMRVATRQLRSTLLGFRTVLRRHDTRPIAEQLKWLGGVLAGERDTEMLIERLTDVLRMVPEDLVLGPVQDDLRAALCRQAAGYEETIHQALDSERYTRLWESLDRLVADPPLKRRAAVAGFTELTTCLAQAYRVLDGQLGRAVELPAGDDRDTTMHEARKTAKRIRYMTETVAPAAGKRAKRLRRRTKKLQNLLGEHQDTVVAMPALRSLGIAAHSHGHNGFTYGLLYAGAHLHSQEVQGKLPEHRERLRRTWVTDWQPRG